MFVTKKKKIQRYLDQKSDSKCAFDFLLLDYLDGTLKEKLISTGIRKVEIHVDWLYNIRCIGIQGRYKEYYMDLQIYPHEFSVSFDLDESDDDVTYPLECKDQIYTVLFNTTKAL